MVKETSANSSRESSIKKRRKNPIGDPEVESDIYKKVIAFEEKEAFKRTAASDIKLCLEICEHIRNIMLEIVELRCRKPPDFAAKLYDKTVQGCSYIIMLKKFNRLDRVRMTSSREAIATDRHKNDSTELQYQNLLYESAHLSSEIKKCKQFKSKDEDVELVSVEEFLQDAPAAKTKPFKNYPNLDNTQKHELHLARLEWELTQRKKLAQQCSSLEDEKKQIAADILKTKNRLSELLPKLVTVLDTMKPLHEDLGLPVEKSYVEERQRFLLPDPLFIFYANADGFKEVHGINITLNILGEQDEAIRWKESQNISIFQNDDTDAENDRQEIEESVEVVKKRRHRKASQIDKNEERRKLLLEVHPLSVQLIIHHKSGSVLTMQFFYLTSLNIIAVTSDVQFSDHITGCGAKEVLYGENILKELFTGDFGLDSPNPLNQYQLKKIGLNSYQSLVPTLGYVYSWAQKVCGLEFLMSQRLKAESSVSGRHIDIVMNALNKRLGSRTSLAVQLQQLEQNVMPTVPESVDMPQNVISSLAKWTSISWQNFCEATCTAALLASEMVSSSDLFYCATITRTRASIKAYIAIQNDYPKQTPIFCLNAFCDGEFHSGNCDQIRDMERAVNVEWSNSSAHSATWLLAAQLRYLCAYFDVFLEIQSPVTYAQNAVFFKNMCGRNKRRPFKFRKVGTGFFTQF
ncbi:hypothetical protein PPYR_13493 [Photinus pyralis]|uniref:THO complex subunit 5 homolog n=1 Tax=Photinus pyralis TaxID=7054 RepID=A0A1Y1LYS6_PHOPY|nr:THO complex subunit 5 homolog [Photinus pyralis]KAB0793873.1 hypothetical protein PPYR_13493 [Photinus pyralis]